MLLISVVIRRKVVLNQQKPWVSSAGPIRRNCNFEMILDVRYRRNVG